MVYRERSLRQNVTVVFYVSGCYGFCVLGWNTMQLQILHGRYASVTMVTYKLE